MTSQTGVPCIIKIYFCVFSWKTKTIPLTGVVQDTLTPKQFICN